MSHLGRIQFMLDHMFSLFSFLVPLGGAFSSFFHRPRVLSIHSSLIKLAFSSGFLKLFASSLFFLLLWPPLSLFFSFRVSFYLAHATPGLPFSSLLASLAFLLAASGSPMAPFDRPRGSIFCPFDSPGAPFSSAELLFGL